MLIINGTTLERVYSVWSFHRWQAAALLDGNLHIGETINQIAHDNAWYNGQVNHVWGLGVGLWQATFEAIWRLMGNIWFPDRIALGIALAWLALYVVQTGWRLGERWQSPLKGIGFIWLLLCCRSLWTLSYGARLVYEETSLYATIVSLALLCATVRVLVWNRRMDFWVCCALAAYSGVVRPTHAIYGLAAVVVCSGVLLLRSRPWLTLLGGNALFAGGLAFLAVTNWLRFGHPGEFGHNLTVTPSLIVYTTRLDNPMKAVTTWEAGRELVGALFFAGDIVRDFISGETVSPAPWPAPSERWRDFYMSTYDPSWLVLSVVGAMGLAGFLVYRLKRGRPNLTNITEPDVALAWGLGLWSAVSLGGLTVFYLRHPNFCSRYLLDLAPGMLALVVGLWFRCPERWIKIAAILLAGWLGFQVVSIQITHPPMTLLTRAQLEDELPAAKGRALASYGGQYNKEQPPQETRIAYNGHGWLPETNKAEHIVILAVDRPEFIELELSARLADAEGVVRADRYKAMINAKFLPEPTLIQEGERIRVRFPVNPDVLERHGDELVFLWFGRDYSPAERESQRHLYSVRWR